ncbi:MAG: hypothetical protein AB7K24_25280, partial [Gemmataceae bacterium]
FEVKLTLDPPADPNAAANPGLGGRVQIAIAANGQAIVIPAGSGGQGSFELQDANGKKIVQVNGNQRIKAGKNNNIEIEHDLAFRPGRDQQPAKLVYLGSQTSTITVPFNLESK